MNNKPLVTIIIPVYNGSNYVKEAINSALAQTYENIEVIVVNDGSNDDGATEQIIKSYGDRVKYIYKENGGVSSALNLGIKEMSGEYFSWLSHDDLYLPQKIQKQVEALVQHNANDALVVCKVKCIDKSGSPINRRAHAKISEGYFKWYEALDFMLKNGSYNGCSLLIPKAALEKVEPFDQTLKYSQDMLMWSRIFLKKFNLISIDDVLVCNRVHDGQLTQKGKDLLHKDSATIARYLVSPICECGEYANGLLYSYAYHNAVLGNKEVVSSCFSANKLSIKQKIIVFFASCYGVVRPIIRKFYYKFFLKVKTS